MLNVYVLEREDCYDWDEAIEQTVVAKTEENAIELANRERGKWTIAKKVNLNEEQVLTVDSNYS